MTLAKRTILIIISTFIALLFILAATSDIILLKSFAALERVVVADNIQKVRNEIEASYDDLLASSQEFGGAISQNGSFSFNKLSVASLRNRHIDFAICFSHNKEAMGSLFTDTDAKKHPIKSGHVINQLSEVVPLAHANSGESLLGLVVLDGRPVQLVLRPLKGSDLLLMVGRYLDDDEANRIIVVTEFVLDLIPVSADRNTPDITAALAAFSSGDETHVQVINQDTVAGYAMFEDVFGHPALIVRIYEDRLLYKQGKAAIVYVISSLTIAVGVFCFVMLFFIRGTVLNRLATLTKKVSYVTTLQDVTARLPFSGQQDEFKDLTVSINSMLGSLENSEKVVRESEERYRMLFERAPDAIMIVGLEGEESGRIVAANQAAVDQHGYTLDELLRMSIYDLNTVETNNISRKIATSIIAGQWVTAELWHQKKDGTQFPVEIHAGLIKIGGKKYILGFDRDITQRKISEVSDRMHLEQISQLNDDLNRKAIDLAAVNYELETFNYSVSHDMRGPLTRISGYCQLLLDEDTNLEPSVKEYISRIYEAEIWLNEMIDALLHLAQISSAEIVSESVNLSEIAQESLNELSFEYPDRSIRTRIEPDIIVSGDPRLLKIVMINLLDNAWKYSSLKSDALIEFGVDQTGRIFYVRDNGAGFNIEDADSLFRVFTRLHDSSQFTGTGIGLATVQRIIFRHGGRIWAKAEAGVGATFFFTLPEASHTTHSTDSFPA